MILAVGCTHPIIKMSAGGDPSLETIEGIPSPSQSTLIWLNSCSCLHINLIIITLVWDFKYYIEPHSLTIYSSMKNL